MNFLRIFLRNLKTVEHKYLFLKRFPDVFFKEYVEGDTRSWIFQVHFEGVARLWTPQVNFKEVSR